MRARITLIVFLLLLSLGICVAMSLQVFRVREVIVTGLTQRTPQQVVEAAQIDYNQSVFQLRLGHMEEAINANPYFEVNDIRLDLPHTLVIDVLEHAERAVLLLPDTLVVMDESGFIVETRSTLNDARVPVITGLNVTSFRIGETVSLPENEAPKLDAMKAVLNELERQQVTYMVAELNVQNLSDIWLVTQEGFVVRLGNFQNLTDKLLWMRATVPLLASEGYTGGTINVSTGKNATFYQTQSVSPDAPSEGEPDGEGEHTP